MMAAYNSSLVGATKVNGSLVNNLMSAFPAAPSAWVRRFAPLMAPGGTVLDVACGGGRHSRLLAAAGHGVEAVDRDAEALAGLASVRGVSVRRADLEDGPWPYAGRRFDGIVVCNYLHRPLFPLLADALADGGVLIYETFMLGNERFGRPSNPDFLLRPNELYEAFGSQLQVVAFEQGEVTQPKPAVVQRLCAVRGPGPFRLA
jgi:SAM-dependent methyltransferase